MTKLAGGLASPAPLTDQDRGNKTMLTKEAVAERDDDMTPEERAALAEDDAPQAAAHEADEEELRARPVAPFAAAAPPDADAHLKIVADYEARAEQMFEDGDISASEYRQAMREVADKRDELKWAKHKADLADQMQKQAEDRAWSKAVREFMSGPGAAINKNEAMKRAFDGYVQAVTGDAANAHLSDKAQLAKAHRLFLADMAAQGVQFGALPGARDAGSTDFAQIDRMIDSDPLRAEEALARMSPEEVERYLS